MVDFNKKVWVPDPMDGFVLGKISDIGSDTITVQITPKKNVRAPYGSVFPAEENEKKDVDDNCALMFLNEATLLNNIRLRYARDQIYTYVANILIAINPYFEIRHLYSSESIAKYQGKSLGQMPPHVFAIADKAYRDMKRLKESQSIIVSGESGAGKTESQKYILRYLCESWGSHSGPIEQRILETNPILEAFGNAKTLRNNNSSRFGKFVEIHFGGPKYEVAGGFVSHYLLEKSRICRQQRGERNFHIFYQLCGGAPPELRHQLRLQTPDHYTYLKYGCTQYFCSSDTEKGLEPSQLSNSHRSEGSLRDPVVDDVKDFRRLDAGFADIGLDKGERFALYAVVAAVLHLGNIRFLEDPEDTHGGCSVAEDANGSLVMAAGLLGVETEELKVGLTSRVMQTTKGGAKGTVIRVPLKIHEAQNARDALAKVIYSRLFDYVVYRINKCIPFGGKTSDGVRNAYIGVLDIAGFEFFAVNGFEQFCINYCNEKLQQFFNDRILRQEQELYEQEGLGVKRIEYLDNQDCIDLIEERGGGILDLLDEENKLPRPSPQHFTSHVHQCHKNHFRLSIPRKSKLREHRDIREDEGFLVRHYAGAVCYQTSLFVEKNNDALHASLEFLIQESKSPLLRRLFQEGKDDNMKTKGKLGFVSVGSKFRSQLKKLMEKLDSAGTHFVRCIKPNSNMVPHEFEGSQILGQLQCSGMTSVLELMQQGYPSRTSFADLYNMYRSVMPPDLARLDPRLFCKCLFKALGLNDVDFKFGLTKVFFRPGKFAEFDQMLRADPAHLAELVKKVKQWLIRIRWKKVQWCALSVIKLRNKIRWRQAHLIRIQSAVRGWSARKKYRPKYKAVMKVKSLQGQLTLMQSLIQSLKNKESGVRNMQEIEREMQYLVLQIRDSPIGKTEVEEKYSQLLRSTENTLSQIRQQAAAEETEHKELQKLQEKMEVEKQKNQREEAEQKEAEIAKQRKLTEEKARKEEQDRLKKEEEEFLVIDNQKDIIEDQQRILEDTERKMQQKYEQERRDRELALRLAKESNGIVEEMSIPETAIKTPINASKYDLSNWKYAELRDIINTSNDVELLEACRDEFRRRLKAFHGWQAKNKEKSTPNQQTAAQVGQFHDRTVGAPSMGSPVSRTQRYFRIPFAPKDIAPNSPKGLWFAHFDGPYIARQMEIHPLKIPVLLIAGRDDKDMLVMSLEETGLGRKQGAEITAHDFEKEWQKNCGPTYHPPLIRQPPNKQPPSLF